MINPLRLKTVLAGGNVFFANVGLADYNNKISCSMKFHFKGEVVRLERSFDRYAGYCAELLPTRTFLLFLDWHLNDEYRLGAITIPYAGKYAPPTPNHEQVVEIFREVWKVCGYRVSIGLADAKDVYQR